MNTSIFEMFDLKNSQRKMKLFSKKNGKDTEVPSVIQINVGGTCFTTQKSTLLREPNTLFHTYFGMNGELPPIDVDGRYFLDRDGKFFGMILNFLRDDQSVLPDVLSGDWNALKREAEYYKVRSLVKRMVDIESTQPSTLENSHGTPPTSGIALNSGSNHSDQEEEYAELQRILELKTELDRRAMEIESRLVEASVDERTKDLLNLELKTVQLEKQRAEIRGNNRGRELIYNLLIVGVTGTGKSSSLNTLLDSDICQISGAQAQGTRGCVLRDATLDPDHFVSYIDTQGLGADTSVSDTELLSQIIMSTESIMKMGIINNILVSFDVNARTTPATMANQLTLMELFSELRRSCFLVFTKWNTNAVQVEWNRPLRTWIRKWKRATSVQEITEDPPSYEDMYQAYCNYVIESLANDMDGGAFSKMGTFLAFFEARVLWMYNLDGIQLEDKRDGCLEPCISRLYYFYRNKALDTLDKGSTTIRTEDLVFLKNDEITMRMIAAQLISSRDEKMKQLEELGKEAKKRKEMKVIFNRMANDHALRIHTNNYTTNTSYTKRIAALAGFLNPIRTGCSIM